MSKRSVKKSESAEGTADVPSIYDIASALQEPFLKIDAQYEQLLDECTDSNQRLELKWLRDAARDVFWKAAVIAVEPGNVVVEKLHKELKESNKKILGMLTAIKDIVQTIKFLTEVVRLAASLATLVGI